MKIRQLRDSVLLALSMVLAGVCVAAEAPQPPGPEDRCAICGMFVAKYPAWVATIEYTDGSRHFFDGPKDLFRYCQSDSAVDGRGFEIWVTDYYTTRSIKARDAFFVTGSDVLGPMGAELVPHASLAHAESFRADHGGDAPLAFDDIDEAVVRALE